MSSAAPISAPDFDLAGIAWLNVNRPLTLSELRGRLVILDFWTYSSVSCLQSLEALRRLEDAFPRELVIIGVHSPKFTAERSLEGVRQAVLRHRITHPIAHDPERHLCATPSARGRPCRDLARGRGRHRDPRRAGSRTVVARSRSCSRSIAAAAGCSPRRSSCAAKARAAAASVFRRRSSPCPCAPALGGR